LITASGRIHPTDAFTAAASNASAMTVSAPISFNAGAASGDLVSANTSCWFALRRQTSGRPIAPLAPAIRILIALSSQLALRQLKSEAQVMLSVQARNASSRLFCAKPHERSPRLNVGVHGIAMV
jgi:hypothetical protein